MSLLLKVVAKAIDPVMASLSSTCRTAEGLRSVLFSPCVAPAAPVQTWGTRPGDGEVRNPQLYTREVSLFRHRRRLQPSASNPFENRVILPAFFIHMPPLPAVV